MIPLVVLPAVSLLVGCSSSSPSPASSAPSSGCAGTEVSGATRLIGSGPVPLPGGGRAVVSERGSDAQGPTARLALGGTAAGEAATVTAHVGALFAVQTKKYAVVRICLDQVDVTG